MSTRKLSTQENFQLRETRSVIVKEQVKTLLRMSYAHKDNIPAFNKKLAEYKSPDNRTFKAESISLAIEYMEKNPNRFSPELREALNDFLIEKNIGMVKTRPLVKIAEKEEGISKGRLVNKLPKNETDTNTLKHLTRRMQKGDADDPGEIICEVIGTNLFNSILGDNSPKLRLYKDEEGNITIVSKFIDNFQTLEDTEEVEEKIKNAKGFAKFFAANVLFADYDIHQNNAGLRIAADGSYHWARIDNGRALSYFIDNNYKRRRLTDLPNGQTAEGFINSMIRAGYPEELFNGLDFICELNQLSSSIDEKKLRKIIKFSLRNLKEAYGDNFLDLDLVKSEFKARMHIDKSVQLTEQLLEDQILENINRLKANLKKISQEQFASAIQKMAEDTDAITQNGKIDYKEILGTLKTSNKLPQSLDLFMKNAIEHNDIEGVIYLQKANEYLGYSRINIDGSSPLEYALKMEKNGLSVKMIKEGFTLNHNSQAAPEKVHKAIQNIIERKSGRNIVQEILEGKHEEARLRTNKLR